MTPAKVYTEMKDSGADWIGKIPATWDISKIGTLYTQRNERVSDRDYPPLSVTMKGILPQLATAAKTDDGDNRKLVRVGDFAINSRSDRRGSCGISPYDGSVSLINTILIPRKKMHPGYYDWLFHTTLFADEFYKWGHGIVDDLWTTRWQEMKRILVPVPPYETQSTIAAYLDTQCAKIDEIIAQAKASIENYKQWKASIIYEAVTKGLDPNVEMKDSGITWIGKIPAHWDYQKVFRCFNVIGSGTTPKSLDDDYYSGEIPWLQSGDINGWYVEETSKHITTEALNTFSALKIYEAPFIAVAMYGASIANTSIVSLDACTNQACCVLSEPAEKIEFEYIFYAILASKEELLLSARGGTQPNISQEIIRQLKLPIPPPKEQQRIITYLHKKVTEIDHLIGEKQSLIDDLESYKKSLIYEVVTGKRRVC